MVVVVQDWFVVKTRPHRAAVCRWHQCTTSCTITSCVITSCCTITTSCISVKMLSSLVLVLALTTSAVVQAGPTQYRVDPETDQAERIITPVSSTGGHMII